MSDKCMNSGCINRLMDGCVFPECENDKSCRLYTTTPTVSIAKSELTTLRAFKTDIEDQYKIIMSEQCADDEKHCTCVPVLRVQAEKLEKVTRHLIGIYMVANEYHDDPEIANEKVNEIFNRLMEK